MATKVCRDCGLEKDEEEFNWRYKGLGIRQPICKDCSKLVRRKHYQEHMDAERERSYGLTKDKRLRARDFVFDYLSYHVCVVCAEYRPEMLQFDHVRGKKYKDISQMVADGEPIQKIQEEIRKCEVVCANCHQLRERRRREQKH